MEKSKKCIEVSENNNSKKKFINNLLKKTKVKLVHNKKTKNTNENMVKKMKRKDLLELLLFQRKRIDELEIELLDVNRKLASKEIIIKKSGSIAEASLKLNEVFEKAQEAANQYLDNIKKKKNK